MTSIFTRNQRHIRQDSINSPEELQATIDSQETEIAALRQQLKALKELYQDAKSRQPPSSPPSADRRAGEIPGDSNYQKQRIEKLMGVVAEREKQMRELHHELQQMAISNGEAVQKESQEKQTALSEIEALHHQFSILKAKVREGQRQQQSQENEIRSFKAEIETAAKQLIQFASVTQQKENFEQECLRLSELQTHLSQSYDQALVQVASLESSLNLNEQVSLAKDARVSELEKTVEEYERKIQTLTHERGMLQENIFKAQSAQEDAEARLKVAHFHLAKKVKETSQLNDRTDELGAQVREYNADLSHSQNKIHELQKLLEEQFHQDKNRQEHLQNSVKEAEALASAWEEKYFKMTEKWQEYEQRFKEVKKLEDRIYRMHTLWANMGLLFEEADHSKPSRLSRGEERGVSTAFSIPHEDRTSVFPPQQAYESNQTPQTLFDIPQSTHIHQHNVHE